MAVTPCGSKRSQERLTRSVDSFWGAVRSDGQVEMKPIVGIGELLWDVYPDGRKVAGDAPFNFAFHCQQLGHPAVIVSRVGHDAQGHELREHVRALGLTDQYVQVDAEHPTGSVHIDVDNECIPNYTIAEDVAWDWITWSEELNDLARHCWSVCFGTLGQRSERSRNTIQQFLRTHAGAGPSRPFRILDVNIRQSDLSETILRASLAQAEWVKLNTDEATVLARSLGQSRGTPREFLQVLVSYPGAENRCVLWTHGEAGCDIWAEEDQFHVPAVRTHVVDTVGAGDAFTAAMVCLYREGQPLRECARFATHYAARVCQYQGATPRIDRADVERAVASAS